MANTEQALSVHLAEFAALRAEIMNCQSAQFSLTAGVIALIGAVLAFTKDQSSLANYSWAVVAAIASLGLLYCDLNRRILRCARYIHFHLRPRISDLFQVSEPNSSVQLQEMTNSLMRWEDYHRGHLEECSPLPAFLQNQGHTFQSVIFLLPAIGFYVAAINRVQVGMSAWLLLAYITDAIVLVLLAIELYRARENQIA